jgi:hypothetical protein
MAMRRAFKSRMQVDCSVLMHVHPAIIPVAMAGHHDCGEVLNPPVRIFLMESCTSKVFFCHSGAKEHRPKSCECLSIGQGTVSIEGSLQVFEETSVPSVRWKLGGGACLSLRIARHVPQVAGQSRLRSLNCTAIKLVTISLLSRGRCPGGPTGV